MNTTEIDFVDSHTLARIVGVTENTIEELAQQAVLHCGNDGRFPLALSIIAWYRHTQDTTAPLHRILPTAATPTRSAFIGSGMEPFDATFGGLVPGAFNLLRSATAEAAVAALGAFLMAGLRQGERVALASFDNPKHSFAKLASYGFSDLEGYLDNEQLVYLYYKPTFTKSLCLSLDYRRLFGEIGRIAGEGVSRLALDNCDVLFNLQSEQLAHNSAVKLMLAAESKQYTTLGTYVRSPGNDFDVDVDRVCQSVLISYLSADLVNDSHSQYRFTIRKSPRIDAGQSLTMDLQGGYGFAARGETADIRLERHTAGAEPGLFSDQHHGGAGNGHIHP